jgi:hypothetical protein
MQPLRRNQEGRDSSLQPLQQNGGRAVRRRAAARAPGSPLTWPGSAGSTTTVGLDLDAAAEDRELATGGEARSVPPSFRVVEESA